MLCQISHPYTRVCMRVRDVKSTRVVGAEGGRTDGQMEREVDGQMDL